MTGNLISQAPTGWELFYWNKSILLYCQILLLYLQCPQI
nr:MAG TPA: hypothetical protein [Caudoviricetes sp.]DAT61122.1 MAG TPA: hypothetical protein [Caudoviricetes sp.]